jgi:hypothetical protein
MTEQLQQSDSDEVLDELPPNYCAPLPDEDVRAFALALRPKDRVAVLFRKTGGPGTWSVWTGKVATAAVVDGTNVTPPHIVYDHDEKTQYAFPQAGFEYGSKTQKAVADDTRPSEASARPPRAVKPTPKPAPAAQPASTTASPPAQAPVAATPTTVTAQPAATTGSPPTPAVVTAGPAASSGGRRTATAPTTQPTVTWSGPASRPNDAVSDEDDCPQETEDGEEYDADVTSARVLLDPRQWGLYITRARRKRRELTRTSCGWSFE